MCVVRTECKCGRPRGWFVDGGKVATRSGRCNRLRRCCDRTGYQEPTAMSIRIRFPGVEVILGTRLGTCSCAMTVDGLSVCPGWWWTPTILCYCFSVCAFDPILHELEAQSRGRASRGKSRASGRCRRWSDRRHHTTAAPSRSSFLSRSLNLPELRLPPQLAVVCARPRQHVAGHHEHAR